MSPSSPLDSPRHSRETAVLKIINELLMQLILVHLPSTSSLSVAFDKMSHSILLSRLSSIGIINTPFNWFHTFTGCTQLIQLHSFKSDPFPVTTGVPQGSVMGLLLFLIYLLPVYHVFHKFTIQLYLSCKPNSALPLSMCIYPT